jgi:hypothetical protein
VHVRLAGLIFLALPLAVAGAGTAFVAASEPEARPQFYAGTPAVTELVSRHTSGSVRKHEFYFTRAIYSSGFGRGFSRRGGGSWSTDYPKGDQQFVAVVKRLARELDVFQSDNAVELDDPELRKFPFVYAVEVGYMNLSDTEIKSLRAYLLAGGFLIVDDFWGTDEWNAFEYNIKQVLPEYAIVDLPLTHALFHNYYDIEEILQVPYHGRACAGGPYHEKDGYVPVVRAIFDERGRMLVLISHNSDLGDAWEWMELACYPLTHSTYAAQLGLNTILYAMSH